MIKAPRQRPNRKPNPRSIDFIKVFLTKEEQNVTKNENITKLIVKSNTNEVMIEISQDFFSRSPRKGIDLNVGLKLGAKVKATIAATTQQLIDKASRMNPRK